MISLRLLIVLLTLGWIYFLWSRRKYYALMLKVPGPKGYPLTGVLVEFFFRGAITLDRIEEYFQKYGNAFLCWVGIAPLYIVADPVLAQEILNSSDCVNKSSYIYETFSDLVGLGLPSLNNPMWSKHRKLLNPAFKHSHLINSLSIYNYETSEFLQLMDSYVGKGERDLMPKLQQLTLSISAQTTMGVNVKEQPNFKDHSLMDSFEYTLDAFPMIMFSPWLKITLIRRLMGLYKPIKNARDEIHNFLNKEITLKLDNPETFNKPVRFIDHALTQFKNGNFTYQNVLDETNVAVFAAFETTAKAINFALILLAMHTQYQDKLFEELLELYPNTGTFDVTYEDLQKLDYLDRIVNESLRIAPTVPLAGRRTAADIKLSNGVSIPKDTNIGISIFSLHRSETIWGPEAKIFNPDNFLPDNIQAKHPYSFIPFTKGIRNCIGWRQGLVLTKITLIKLLRNFKVSTNFLYNNLVFIECATMKLEKMPQLEFERRMK